jgi:hypothetical protein
VLRRLGPRDLASIAGVDRACAAVVAATALMQWAKEEKELPPRSCLYMMHAPRLSPLEACSLAAGGGHLEVLKWLHYTGCPRYPDTCAEAALGGHLEVLKWLHSTGCPWTTGTFSAAAFGGHLEVLNWLHRSGCPCWDGITCCAAARGGHLEALKWLHNAGCPCDSGNVSRRRCRRTPGGAEVAAQNRLPVGQ